MNRLFLLFVVVTISSLSCAAGLLGQNFAYVGDATSNTVTVLNTVNNTIVANVTVGANPAGVAITPNRAYAYVANSGSSSVSVIDIASNTVVATVGVGAVPAVVAITPDGTRAYVSNNGANSVSLIDTASNAVVATVAVGNSPDGLAISPDGTRVYVVNFRGQRGLGDRYRKRPSHCRNWRWFPSRWSGHYP
jgi:YVTN family beta-propeller protein